MLSVLEIEEKNIFTKHLHQGIMSAWCVCSSYCCLSGTTCVCHNPVYHYITVTAVYLTTCILVIVQNITTLLLLLCTWYTVLDVLTSLSDCRHETVERIMERRISGVSYMCWMDFPNAILCCGFLCAQLTSVYSVTIYIAPATTPRATTPHPYHHGLSRLCICLLYTSPSPRD